MNAEQINEKMSSFDSMREAALFLRKQFGNSVAINVFTGKGRHMIGKLIEYSYLMFKEKDVYLITVNCGTFEEFKNILNAPCRAPLINNQYESTN